MGEFAHGEAEIHATPGTSGGGNHSIPPPTDHAIATEDSTDTHNSTVTGAKTLHAGNPVVTRESVVTPDQATNWRVVRIPTPVEVKVAFDETLDLYRAVEGREESTTSFVEALVAEASSGLQTPTVELDFIVPGRSRWSMEDALAEITSNWSHLNGAWSEPVADDEVRAKATTATVTGGGADHDALIPWFLETATPWPLPAPEGSDPDARIRWLLEVEECLERRLGELLAGMDDAGAWRRLQFAGLGHYAEQRLGLARSTAHERARLAKALRRLEPIRQACEAGHIGLAAALCLVRILGEGPVDDALQRQWVERARRATVKRLQDEARALQRLQVAERFPSTTGDQLAECSPSDTGNQRTGCSPSGVHHEPAECSPPTTGDESARGPGRRDQEQPAVARHRPPRPLSDAEWHASLRREAGTTRERVWNLGRAALSEALSGTGGKTMLRMTLPEDLAQSFLGTVEAARRLLADQVQMQQVRPEDDEAPSAVAARTFSNRGQAFPSWVGLLALLEEFVETWDVRHGKRRPSEDAVHNRDGWRCMASGCTSRRNLQEHHVRYRSQGGNDELWNRVCLCEFHHLRGEHGEFASCRGEAPLGLEWSLGRGGRGGLFRNEMRLIQSWMGEVPTGRQDARWQSGYRQAGRYAGRSAGC
jgi:hypothetical protein